MMIVLTWYHPFMYHQRWSPSSPGGLKYVIEQYNITSEVDLLSRPVNDQVNTIQYHVTNPPYQINNINNTFHTPPSVMTKYNPK